MASHPKKKKWKKKEEEEKKKKKEGRKKERKKERIAKSFPGQKPGNAQRKTKPKKNGESGATLFAHPSRNLDFLMNAKQFLATLIINK